ncbi:hypothetical protein RHSIM_Rhsim01G0157000 [Rhododendron simsii]|uniref:Recombination initiation defects 3 n=1 Tax=Rhododendron simsii TaxID=118357 RepID=A0A834HGV7_RHOSS|nr:hypothetical protein RHSIM_Rhsim01G0157000 [Rhododendron simsii]
MFSQLSQNSLDEIVTNDQRISSQERENPVKKLSCLPPISNSLEESQMQVSRSSSNLMRKWNSSSVLDHRSQTNEELERRIGMMETSLNRFGMIMDSVQSDIMQVSKGTKEALMEKSIQRRRLCFVFSKRLKSLVLRVFRTENSGLVSIVEDVRQKLIANGNLLQAKGQEDIKTNLAGGIKSLSDQVSQDTDGEKLKEISSFILTLPEQIDVYLQKMQSELCNKLTQEKQAMVCRLKVPNQNHLSPAILLEEGISCRSVQQQMQPLKGPEMPPRSCGKTALLPKIEVGSWTSVKTEQATFTHRGTSKKHKQKRMSPIELEREWRIPIESDEEIDGGFSCLLGGKETGNYSMAEAKEETKRILRKARRRKRKHSNLIILD